MNKDKFTEVAGSSPALVNFSLLGQVKKIKCFSSGPFDKRREAFTIYYFGFFFCIFVFQDGCHEGNDDCDGFKDPLVCPMQLGKCQCFPKKHICKLKECECIGMCVLNKTNY